MLMEFGQDPALKARKEIIFKRKELARFGVKNEQELTLEQRAQWQFICNKNLNQPLKKLDNGNNPLDEINSEVGDDENKEGDLKKINKFSNGFGLFDKSKCSDIYKTV